MVRDAETNAEDDRKKKEAVDTRNQAENLVYSTKKSLKEIGDKVDGAARGDIENGIRDLEDAIKGDNVELIRSRMNALQEAAYKLSEAAYQAAQGQQSGGAGGGYEGGGQSGAEEEVVEEADYEVIDEDKK
jgi:molecular chaperone DnaK